MVCGYGTLNAQTMTELATFDISLAYALWHALWMLHRGSRTETDKWIKEC